MRFGKSWGLDRLRKASIPSRGREGRVNVGCLWNVSNMICIELNYNKTQDKALKSKLE